MAQSVAVAGWERRSLYLSDQAQHGDWETKAGATPDVWRMYRETGTDDPQAVKPRIAPAPMGDGLSIPLKTDFQVGKARAAFTGQLPLSPITMRDIACLLLQDKQSGGYWVPPTIPTVSHYATMVTLAAEDNVSDLDSAYVGDAMLVRDWNITIPQNAGGEDGGLVSSTSTWIGKTATLEDGYTMNTAGTDTAGFLQTRGCTFALGGVTKKFVSAVINISTGAYTLEDAGPTPIGLMLGRFACSGTVTVLDEEGVAATANKILRDEVDATSISTVELDFSWNTAAEQIIIQTVLMGKPAKVDVGGANAWTYNWTIAGDGTDSFQIKAATLDESIFHTAA